MSNFKVQGDDGTKYVIINKHDEAPKGEKKEPTFHKSEGDKVMIDGDGNGIIDATNPYLNYEMDSESSGFTHELENLHLPRLEGIKLKGLSFYLDTIRANDPKKLTASTLSDVGSAIDKLNTLLQSADEIGLSRDELRVNQNTLEAGDIIDSALPKIINTIATAIDHNQTTSEAQTTDISRLIQLAQDAKVNDALVAKIKHLSTRSNDRKFDHLILAALGPAVKPTLDSLRYLAQAKEVASQTSTPELSEKIIETMLGSIEISFDEPVLVKGSDTDTASTEGDKINQAAKKLEQSFPGEINILYQRIFNLYNNRHARDLKYIYEKYLSQGATGAGQVKIDFTISPQGEILGVNVSSNTIKNDEFLEEIRKYALHLQFPANPNAKENITIHYPINFIGPSEYAAQSDKLLTSKIRPTYNFLSSSSNTTEAKGNLTILTDAEGQTLWSYVGNNGADANFNDGIRMSMQAIKFPPTPDHTYGLLRVKYNYSKDPAVFNLQRNSSS